MSTPSSRQVLESFHAQSYEQGLNKGREVIARYRVVSKNVNGAAQVAIGETRMTFPKTTTIVPGTSRCAPQKVDPALIARFRPATVGCFQPIFFFADHRTKG